VGAAISRKLDDPEPAAAATASSPTTAASPTTDPAAAAADVTRHAPRQSHDLLESVRRASVSTTPTNSTTFCYGAIEPRKRVYIRFNRWFCSSLPSEYDRFHSQLDKSDQSTATTSVTSGTDCIL
jgi:hypothetical protein